MIPQALQGERLLSRYRIVEIKTSGGFGVVYICWDEKLKRRVAIKSIPLTDELGVPLSEAIPDALAEARTAGFLNHPCIVKMLDFEEDTYAAYLIMEHIDGCTLAELIQQAGMVPFDETAHIIEQLAGALSFAHENGVLHLDIKPENILIDYQGNVKLTDFGMANLASAAGYMGARGGTLGYMPPEQLASEAVDERSDIFALACVCYEMLSAEAPFKAANLEDSRDLILMGARSLKEYDPEITTELELVLERALSPMPDIRYKSVKSFAHALLEQLGEPREGKLSLVDTLENLNNDTPCAPQLPIDLNEPAEPSLCERIHPYLSSGLGTLLDCVLYTLISYRACQILQQIISPASSFSSSSELSLSSIAICAVIGLFACFIPQLAFALALCLMALAWIFYAGFSPLDILYIFACMAALAYWWARKARLYPNYLRIIALPCLLGPYSLICALPYLSAALSVSSTKKQTGLPAWCKLFRKAENQCGTQPQQEGEATDQNQRSTRIDSFINCLIALVFSLSYSFYAHSSSILSFSGDISSGISQEPTNSWLFFLNPANWMTIALLCLASYVLSLLFQRYKQKELKCFEQLKQHIDEAISQADFSIETHFSHYENYKQKKKSNRIYFELLLVILTVMNYLLLSLANLMNFSNYSSFSPLKTGFALLISAIIYLCIYLSVGNPAYQDKAIDTR